MSAEYRSWVEVSRKQIVANYKAAREAIGSEIEIAAVIKADAYGHGALEVARILSNEGVHWFAVSSVDEGVLLRRNGIAARILVMADSLPSTRPALLEYDLTPVVHSLEDLKELDLFARSRDVRLRYHLKIDTGMGRLGTVASPLEIVETIRGATHLELGGVMSHLASAADYSTTQSDHQAREFEDFCRTLHSQGIAPPLRHLASTNAVAYGRREAFHNMVRLGHALYGYISPARGQAPHKILDVQPALTWKAAVLTSKTVPEGALVGYGGMFRAPRAMRIAVLAVGYADGLSHRLSNRGHVMACGQLLPILGAVSMDVTTIDITGCPSLKTGDSVTLLGSDGDISINAQQMARTAGTISYDILCGIRARIKRIYVA